MSSIIILKRNDGLVHGVEIAAEVKKNEKRIVNKILSVLDGGIRGLGDDEVKPYLKLEEIGETGFPTDTAVYAEEIGVIYYPSKDVREVTKMLEASVDVNIHELIIEEDGICRAFDNSATLENTASRQTTTAEIVPWGVKHVRAPQAWVKTKGDGVSIAIIDTGVNIHADLPRATAGKTFVSGTNNYYDGNGHGTHVAGTALALMNNLGVVGVAPAADLLVARVLGSNGNGQYSWVEAGIMWAANAGADVINLSLGGGSAPSSLKLACDYAHSKGCLLVAAAGNEGNNTKSYPAAYDNVVCVAATDRSDRKATFSQYHSNYIDVAAPGVDILSTVKGNGYEDGWNGTSMACPHAAGVAALVRATRSISPDDLKTHLKATARNLGSSDYFGAGIVQADKAVNR